MNTSLYISAGALQAYQQKIDTSANNMANVNTPGFKRREQSFSEILASQINNRGGGEETGRLTQSGIRVGYGVKAGMTQRDMSQGLAMETGNPFDLMIGGSGFFQIGTPSANGDVTGTHYTRDGNFHLSPNPNGQGTYHLVHANGGYLLDQDGNPIEFDSRHEVKIEANGQIQLKNKQTGAITNSTQRVGIADIQNPHLLKNTGDNQYTLDESVLPRGAVAGDYVRIMGAEESRISAGFLEGSNVDLAKEMTDMMATQRGYQMNSRAISYADQMMGIANSILK